jgi:hypothetical protein
VWEKDKSIGGIMALVREATIAENIINLVVIQYKTVLKVS